MGCWDENCLICGCCINDTNNNKEYEWLEKLFIINNQNKIIKINNASRKYEDAAAFNLDNSTTYFITSYLWHVFDNENYGVCCHQACYQLLFKKFGYKLLFSHVCRYLRDNRNLLKIKYKPINNLIVEQYFPFDKIPSDYLKTPLKNKVNADRILGMWKPLVAKFSQQNIRNSPCESTTKFKLNKILHGNDGKKYIVKKDKNKVRKWVLLN